MTEVRRSDPVDTDPSAVVAAYLHAVMRDKDFETVRALLAEDVVYENVGYPTMRGADRIVSSFRRIDTPKVRFDVKIHRIAREGSSVLTERTDAVIIGRFQAHFWVCGVFEVHDGRITLWRDYFDVFDMIKGTVRALIALAVPSLRRTL
jgi:limonene-1,2-epoxide hydrolase